MNRLEIARQYLEELLRQRQDIVAAWVGGSVARGEETAASDIDLELMVAGAGVMNRAGLDTWREGVYVEAGVVFQQEYSDLEAVLNDSFKATSLNGALILYDPTGFVTQLQNAMRPLYMQPQWLSKRLVYWLEQMRSANTSLGEAVRAGDAVRICSATGWFVFGCGSIPLLRAGITPSSSRALQLLVPVNPAFRTEIAAFEGSTQMSANEVLALEPLLHDAVRFCDASFGQLPLYFTKKSLWMAQQGDHEAALHAMWIYVGAAAADGALALTDPAEQKAASALMQGWLQRTHFEGAGVLEAKLHEAESLLRQAEEMARVL